MIYSYKKHRREKNRLQNLKVDYIIKQEYNKALTTTERICSRRHVVNQLLWHMIVMW